MKLIEIKKVLFFVSAMAVFFVACEKENTSTVDIQTAEDDALATDLYEDVFSEVDDAMAFMENSIYGGGLKSETADVCKTITVEYPNDSTFWPRTVTVDYGDGCVKPNGRTRKGKIIIEVYGRYMSEDYYRIVTFENFFINEHKIEGQKTVTNEGRNENGNIYFSIELTDGKVTSPDGKEFTRKFSKYREWIAGAETPRFRWDDEYLISGVTSGVNRNEVAYTRTILVPLHKAKSCRWIQSGVIEVVAEGRETATLDYGDGNCDKFATVTVGDETRIIELHR